jgi:hypothetical protein
MLQDVITVLSANSLRWRYCVAFMPADADLPIPVLIFTFSRHHACGNLCKVSKWLLTADLVLPECSHHFSALALYAIVCGARPESE